MADGLKNTFEFLIKQCTEAPQGFEQEGAMRPFAVPEPEESFSEPDMLKLFDRQEFEESYATAVNNPETENTHKDMMKPSLMNDIVAGFHRDTFLRHTNRISRFIAENSRRKNHSANVHPKRQQAIKIFESLQGKVESVKGEA